MAVLKEKDIQNLLERQLEMALALTGNQNKKYSVKRMGRVNRYESMSAGYYIQVQNFDNLSVAKKSENDSFVRYAFRCILFKNFNKPLYEISKWMPSRGSVDNDYVIYRSDSKKSDGKFLERLVTAINFVDLNLAAPAPEPKK